MKKFLPFVSFAVFFAACSTKPEAEIKTLQSTQQASANLDTAGLAQFQQWKAQNELTAADVQQPVIEKPEKTVTVIRERVIERQRPVRTSSAPNEKPIITAPDDPNVGAGTSQENTDNSGSSNQTTEPVATTPEVAKKEGWSKAAKGAAIGGAGGAVLGAIINKKNPAVGAVIGGVVGGAVGYGVGRGADKKDGRY